MTTTPTNRLSRKDLQYIIVVLAACVSAALGGGLAETLEHSLIGLSVPCVILLAFAIRSTQVNRIDSDHESQEQAANQVYMLGFLSSLCSMVAALAFNPSTVIGEDLIEVISSKLTITIFGLLCLQFMTQIAKTWRREAP